MIIVRLIGRMGNQLFQHAFAISEQKRLRTYAVIDDRFQRDIVSEYFSFKGIFQNRLIKRIVFRLNKFPIVYQDGGEDVRLILEKEVGNNKYYYAYFQSEKYFETIRAGVRKKIRIRQKFLDEFQQKYGDLFRNNRILAIHYRFGDYVNWTKEDLGGTNFTLPDSYYSNALALIPDLDSYLVLLVTDDIDTCNSRTGHLTNKLVISDSEIMDFQILMNADKLIVANSSFSWWAAYLNIKNAEVFAPEYWLGFKVGREFPHSIIPPHFIKVRF
jgi:Glycosyl transferase family 11